MIAWLKRNWLHVLIAVWLLSVIVRLVLPLLPSATPKPTQQVAVEAKPAAPLQHAATLGIRDAASVPTTSSVRIYTTNSAGASFDPSIVSVAIIR